MVIRKEKEMNGAKPPGTPLQISRQVQIDLNKQPTVTCPICGCSIFATNIAMYKKLSDIQVGKPILARVELALCQDCGAIVQAVGDELRLVEAVPKEEEKPDGKVL